MPVDSAPKSCLLRLPVGSVIQVTSTDKSLSYMTHLVGIDGERSIISNIPSMKQLNKEGAIFEDIFYAERPLIMRVVASGLVYAFQTTIMGCYRHGNTHTHLLLSTYPGAIQQRNLRKEARYPCTIPSDIVVGDQTFNGVVTNISSGGCLFCLMSDKDVERLQTAKTEGEVMTIQIHFPLADNPDRIEAKICSSKTEDDLYKLGLSFEKDNTNLKRFMDALHLESVSALFS